MEIGAPTPALIYLAADSFVVLVDEPGGICDRCLKGAPKYSLHCTTWRFGARRVTRCCGNGKVGPRAFTCNFNGFASLSSIQSPYWAGYRISGLRQISSTDKANLGIATHRDAASTVGCDHRDRWGSPVSRWLLGWPLSPKTFDTRVLVSAYTCTPPEHPICMSLGISRSGKCNTRRGWANQHCPARRHSTDMRRLPASWSACRGCGRFICSYCPFISGSLVNETTRETM